MDIKLIFAIIASAITVTAYFPYFKDIFSLKTKPHVYTWLIWTITQSVALLGLIYGKAGWGSLSLLIGTVFVFFIFLFSLKYGTRDITKFDTAILIISLLSVVVWFQVHNYLLAVFIATATDVLGYVPSFRKSYHDPRSETVITWVLFGLANLFALLALSRYNLLTITYLTSIFIANIALALFCSIRKRFV